MIFVPGYVCIIPASLENVYIHFRREKMEDCSDDIFVVSVIKKHFFFGLVHASCRERREEKHATISDLTRLPLPIY